jgi:WD40 repeat protein
MQHARLQFSILIPVCVPVAVFITALAHAQPPRQAQTEKVARPVPLDGFTGLGPQGFVPPISTLIRLVDARGRPVTGAVVADYFSSDDDREPSFAPQGATAAKISDQRGEASLELDISRHQDGAGVYALLKRRGRPLVGIHKVTRAEIGNPVTIRMHPACRVLFQIGSPGLSALEKQYHADLTGPGWWRAAYVRLGGRLQAPRPLFTCSTTGNLEFLLPPGQFEIFAYGDEVKPTTVPLEIKPDDRELVLGTIELAPTVRATRGEFPRHRRVRLNSDGDAQAFVLRPVRHRSLMDDNIGDVVDVAFSPDGKVLAAAHTNRRGRGEVKLWDWEKGLQLARPFVPDTAVGRLAFSPDGTRLFGLMDAVTKPKASAAIILWDIASRELVRAAGHGTEGIVALASSPDGKLLASSGESKTQLWDLASGREVAGIASDGSWGQSLAFAPDGRTLAVGSQQTIKLWDVAGDGRRPPLTLDTETLTVCAVAYSPDGLTLAAAGSMLEPGKHEGQVWLYDVVQRPVRRRAVLTFHRQAGLIQENVPIVCSDVVFTPDGRSVIAIAVQHVRTWAAATAIDQNAFQRFGPCSQSDRLAVSRDGQWLAIIGPNGVDFVDVP